MRLDYLRLSWIALGRYSGGNRNCILREQVALGQIDMNPTQTPIDRLKVLINSSTPIVVMETVEEVQAVSLVRSACSELNLAVFEWTIADGLVRSGGAPALAQAYASRPDTRLGAIPQGNSEADRLARAVLSAVGSDAAAAPKTAVYNIDRSGAGARESGVDDSRGGLRTERLPPTPG